MYKRPNSPTSPTSPLKSALKKTDTKVASPYNSHKVSFNDASFRNIRPNEEALLKASRDFSDNFDDDDDDDEIDLSASYISANSNSSAGSIHEELKDKGKKYELKNQEAHIIVNQEIMCLIDDQIHAFALQYFPQDRKDQVFASYVILNTFYHKKNVNIKLSRELETIEQIRDQRTQEVNNLKEEVNKWLKKVSLPNIAERLKTKSQEFNPLDKFATLFFQIYLCIIVANTPKLNNYLTEKDLITCIFIDDNEHLHSFDSLYNQFSDKLVYIRQCYEPHSFVSLLFERFLLINIETFFVMRSHANFNVDFFNQKFSTKIIELKSRFEEKLTEIIHTLPASIPLWQTWYLLFFHGPELLTEPDTKEVTIKKFTALYNASHQNHGQKGRELAAELMQALPEDFASCYFKVDRRTGERKFRTREELEQTVRYATYNPLTYFYPTFYRQAQETLEFFSHKPQQDTSPLNSK